MKDIVHKIKVITSSKCESSAGTHFYRISVLCVRALIQERKYLKLKMKSTLERELQC